MPRFFGRRIGLAILGICIAGALMAWAATRPAIRAAVRDSRVFLALNHPVLRRLDSWIYNRRGRFPGRLELGDGRPVTEIELQDPMGVGQDREGNTFLSDRGSGGPGRVIWKVAPNGLATIIAGTGLRGIGGSGIPAVDAALGTPQSLTLDTAGQVYFADSYNHSIFRVGRDGMLTRVAGNNRPGNGGDGGSAVEAGLNQPYDVSLDQSGNLYIADFGNHRIRKVTRDGRIRTIAGTGVPGYSGDGGPAVQARLNGPYGVFAGRHGQVLIGDSYNNVVRRIDRRGIIQTIAGTGRRGHSGHGGPALEAELDSPQAINVDAEGRIYIGDEHNHTLRVIERDGTIWNVLGTGSPGFAPDGTPAVDAALDDPENLWFRTDGTMLLTESGNRRVRLLGPDSLLRTFAGGSR